MVAWGFIAIRRAMRIPDEAGGSGSPFLPGFSRKENHRRMSMTVAKVEEISSTSTVSFEDAIAQGLARAIKTLRNVRSAWVKEQHVRLDGKKIVEYQVNLVITFVLDD
jgi:dodecin